MTLLAPGSAGFWRRKRQATWSTALVTGVSVTAILALLVPVTASAQTFTYTGQEQDYTVPAGITILRVTAVGGDGGVTAADDAGHGASVSADLVVTPGEQLYVEVGGAGQGPPNGQGGLNGGGVGGNEGPTRTFGGGGASDVRTLSCGPSGGSDNVGCPGDSTSVRSRILVAGGGGGEGAGSGIAGSTVANGNGGNAGEDGSDNIEEGNGVGFIHTGGYAGTVTAAGGGGSGCAPGVGEGAAGSASTGGTGGDNLGSTEYGSAGGGGGGGYYGGGGGGACFASSTETLGYGGGGGGGSDFVAAGATDVSGGPDSTQNAPGTVTITPTAPAALSPPGVSGAVVVGQPLTVVHGAWTNSPSAYTYVWDRCDPTGANCFAIPGAVGSRYFLTSADLGSTIRVQETAANAYGTGSPSTSAPTTAVAAVLNTAVPVSVAPPTIVGVPVEGQPLFEQRGVWANAPTVFAYQWLQCNAALGCRPIKSATSQTYVLGPADIGSVIEVQEVAANAFGPGAASVSAPTSLVTDAPISLQTFPEVSTTSAVLSGSIAQFTQPGGGGLPARDYSAKISWGDRQTSTGRVVLGSGGVYLIDASHVYNSRGSYTITVRVAADAGASAQDSDRVSVFAAVICPKGSAAGNRNCLGELELALPTGCLAPGNPLSISIPTATNIASVTYTIEHTSLKAKGTGNHFTAHITTKGLKRGTHQLAARITFRSGQPPKISRTRPFAIC